MTEEIPDKTYFKIGEVATIVGIKTSVLRYWETEFFFLAPEKSSAGQRLYTRQNIETVQQIKQLLYQEKYTIEGVRKKLAPRKLSVSKKTLETSTDPLALLRLIQQDLLEIRASL